MHWYPSARPAKPGAAVPWAERRTAPVTEPAAWCTAPVVHAKMQPMNLEPGEARFVPAADGSPVIAAAGEIDVATAPDLTAALDGMIERGAKAISVDMEHVTFIDSSGLGALVAALKKAQQTDATLTLVHLTGSARKVFEITGLLETFGVDGAHT